MNTDTILAILEGTFTTSMIASNRSWMRRRWCPWHPRGGHEQNVYNDKVRIVSPDNQLLYEVENIRKLPKKRGRATSQKEAAMDAVFSYCRQWLGATFEMPKGIENEFAQGNVPDSVLLSPSVATFAKADAATPSTSMEERKSLDFLPWTMRDGVEENKRLCLRRL